MEMLWNIFMNAALDSLKILPFLFLSFYLLELLEQRAAEKVNGRLERAGSWGPLAGAGLGLLPSAGFSAFAANLYAGGVISLGTLLALWVSTSDEALLILLAEPGQAGGVWPLLLAKFAMGAAAGYLAHFAGRALGKGDLYQKARMANVTRRLEEAARRAEEARRTPPVDERTARAIARRRQMPNMRDVTRKAFGAPAIPEELLCPCGCGRLLSEVEAERAAKIAAEEERARHFDFRAALAPAIRRTEIAFLLIFAVSLVISLILGWTGLGAIRELPLSGTLCEPVLAVLIGLIPDPAGSIILAKLYLKGALGLGAFLGGLSSCSGFGLLLLFRNGKSQKTNFLAAGLLFMLSVLLGGLLALALH